MTTAAPAAPPLYPVTFDTRDGEEQRLMTPKDIEEYAQSLLDPTFASAPPGLRPSVDVFPVEAFPRGGGIGVRVYVTGEGYTGETEEVRTYPLRRLADEVQIRSAIWLQVAFLLRKLTPITSPDESPDEEGE